MKIIYNQSNYNNSGLSNYVINNCYFKKLIYNADKKTTTNKSHHHTGFEIHCITNGHQEYNIENKKYVILQNSFLIISPNVVHKLISSAPNSEKYSITFNFNTDDLPPLFFGKIPERFLDNANFIESECANKKEISPILIENSILENIITLLRLAGIKEKENTKTNDENSVITMAKEYIKDNIQSSPSVKDIASYCYLSEKQLTRIFNKNEGVTPNEYIIKIRILAIEKLLQENTLSLKEISEKMNFSSEYYLNAFFKKNYGMPPGEYRKMLGK